jgi:3'-phosphoadenosine 5'-phosphosulfate sulfotransferase (PAPS reductase)/FAD synthetase
MTPDIDSYDWVLVNSSAGKDSQAMLDLVVEVVPDKHRIVVAHADLGRVEWKGTRELAETQAKHYGLRFEVVSRPQGDLLTHVEKRGMWPSPKARYCTSDHKRGQIRKVMTKLAAEAGCSVRILNCMGIRADESPARKKKRAFEHDTSASNGRRCVDNWLPIHSWTAEEVWERIKASGVPHHPAYDLGMPRLSCCFCIYAPKAALELAAKHNPELHQEYIRVERLIGHRFKNDLAIADIQPSQDAAPIASWRM